MIAFECPAEVKSACLEEYARRVNRMETDTHCCRFLNDVCPKVLLKVSLF